MLPIDDSISVPFAPASAIREDGWREKLVVLVSLTEIGGPPVLSHTVGLEHLARQLCACPWAPMPGTGLGVPLEGDP
jgi:hypothetical protein